MDKKPANRTSRPLAVILLALLLLLVPVFYVLSVGPVFGMVECGWIGKSWVPALETIYLPLRLATVYIPGCDILLSEYQRLWAAP
jgi:hypothetical protein